MSDEIILSDIDSNLIEYIEVNNSALGTFDAASDMVVLGDYNSNIPVIRPPYVAENVANKKNDLSNPNTTGYTSTLAVYNAITGISQNTYTKSEINAYSASTLNNINSRLLISTFSGYTGNTLIEINNKLLISTFSGYTGNTIPQNYYNKTEINNYSANTLNNINSRLLTSTFSGYTGNTIPQNYYNKTEINNYTGKTNNIFIDIQDPTGFINNDNIAVFYDNLSRTITLSAITGNIEYYFNGTKYSLGAIWTSLPHPNTNNSWFLYSTNGININWSTIVWNFNSLMVAAKPTDVSWALREVHGIMPYNAHIEFHKTIGTYRNSGFGLTSGTYSIQPVNPIDSDNTPGFEAGIINDEDISTVISKWDEGQYTLMYFISGGTFNINTGQSTIFRIGNVYPKINIWNNNSFSEIEMSGNTYANWYVLRIPVTLDSYSQQYRAVILQPQYYHTSLSNALNENPQTLNLGNLTNLIAEFILVERITLGTNINYSGATGNVRIEDAIILTGTRFNQTNLTIGGGSGNVSAGNVSIIPTSPFVSTNLQNLSDEYANTFNNINSLFNSFTGTTLPANYYNKTQINNYSASTLININNRLLTTTFNLFTGTTLPNNYYNVSQINSFTGTTLPNTYYNKTQINNYTGTTVPNTYYNKTQINSYSASTNAQIINIQNQINSLSALAYAGLILGG